MGCTGSEVGTEAQRDLGQRGRRGDTGRSHPLPSPALEVGVSCLQQVLKTGIRTSKGL
jgi:hypothetical protein